MLTVSEANKLRRNDTVFSRTVKTSGAVRVTKWKVLVANAQDNHDDIKVNVKIIHEGQSGRLTNNNLDEFYLSFEKAYKDREV